MTEPLIEDLQVNLHGALLSEQVLCDYHGTPVSLATNAPVLVEGFASSIQGSRGSTVAGGCRPVCGLYH